MHVCAFINLYCKTSYMYACEYTLFHNTTLPSYCAHDRSQIMYMILCVYSTVYMYKLKLTRESFAVERYLFYKS
jgi:hypothetical protein